MRRGSGNGGEFSSDALDDYSDEPDFKVDPEAYVRHIAKAKEAVRIPIIGSLNGSTFGGWQRYARLIEQAGADALELNIYTVPTDPGRIRSTAPGRGPFGMPTSRTCSGGTPATPS